MKRLILILFAVLLVFDLADDGSFGNSKLCSPSSSVEISTPTSKFEGSCKIDFRPEVAATNLPGPFSQANSLPRNFKVQPYLERILSSSAGSSGGAPL